MVNSSDHIDGGIKEFLLKPNPFNFPTTSSAPPPETRDGLLSSDQSTNIATPSTSTAMNLTPIYSVSGFGVSQRVSDHIATRPGLVVNGIPGGGDCKKLCPRHQRMANETNKELQEEIEKLPQSDQEAINTAWSLFSSSNGHRRRLILSGILTICCPSQLTFLSDSIRTACRTDPFIRLPKEISLKILSYFDAFSLGKAAQVSKLWKKLADDDLLWRKMCQQHIERTCHKCGWGLPSMEKRKRSHQSQPLAQSSKRHQSDHPSSISATASSSSSDSPSAAAKGLPPEQTSTESQHDDHHHHYHHHHHHHHSHSRHEQQGSSSVPDCTKPWKSVYTERLALERNWRKGIYSERVLSGHSDSITCLQVEEKLTSPTWPVLMTASSDRTIRVWNLEKMETIRIMRGHTHGVRCIQFDCNKLISGGTDSMLKIWNWRTGECIRTIEGHSSAVTCLNFDDQLLVSGSADSTIRVWDFNTGSGYLLRGHQDWINSVKIRKSKEIYSAADDGQIRIWNLETRQTVKALIGHVAQVQSISLIYNDSDLNFLVSGSLDNCLKIWNLDQDDGICERTLFGHIQGVWSVAADRLRIVSGSHDRSLKIWDRVTGKCVHTLVGHRGAVTTVGLTDDKVISGGDDGEVRIWWFGSTC